MVICNSELKEVSSETSNGPESKCLEGIFFLYSETILKAGNFNTSLL